MQKNGFEALPKVPQRKAKNFIKLLICFPLWHIGSGSSSVEKKVEKPSESRRSGRAPVFDPRRIGTTIQVYIPPRPKML